MATIAGYTICFLCHGVVRQITMAADDRAIEKLILHKFGLTQVLSRAPLDANALRHLKLAPGELMEWVPLAR